MAEYIFHSLVGPIREGSMEIFQEFIHDLESEDETTRSRADFTFRVYTSGDPDSLFVKISSLLQHESPQTRNQAAVLLHKDLPSIYRRLSNTSKECIEKKIFECVLQQQQQQQQYRQQQQDQEPGFQLQRQQQGPDVTLLCNIIAGVISSTNSQALMATVVRFLSVSKPNDQEIAFLILSSLPRVNPTVLSSVKMLRTIFHDCLTRGSVTLRSAVVAALVKFLPHLLDRHDFIDLVPHMLDAFSNAVQLQEDREAKKIMKLLTELARTEPRCFERHLEQVVVFMLDMGRLPELMYQEKYACFRFLISLIDEVITSTHEMLPLVSSSVGILKIMEAFLEMLTDIEMQEEDVINASDHDEDGVWRYQGESDNYQLGKRSLRELASVLHKLRVLPQVHEPLVTYTIRRYKYGLEGSHWLPHDWRQTHAAMISLTVLGREFLRHKWMLTFDWIKCGMIFEHPLVNWAAISSLIRLRDIVPDNKIHLISHHMRPHLQNHMNSSNMQIRARAREACSFWEIGIPRND